MKTEGWEGSNVDIGTVEEIDEELRHRAHLLDDALEESRKAARELEDSSGAYHLAFARSVSKSNQKANAGRERQAKTECVIERVRHERAQLLWDLANLAVKVGMAQLTGVQTRAANLRGQMQMDGTVPSYAARRQAAEAPPPPQKPPKAPF